MEDFRLWIDQQQDTALTIGILSRRFWEMCPGELSERWQMFQRREEREWERTAWLVHHVLSGLVGSEKAPTVDRLMGRVTDA